MMLAHVKLIDDSLQMRARSLYGQYTFLLERLARHASILNVPRCIFKHAIRLPYINQLLTHRPRGGVVSEAVSNGLYQVAGTRSDMLRECI